MIIKKTDFDDFIRSLQKKYDVYGPTENKFSKIDDPDKITLDRKTTFSARKFFFPNKEDLFTFSGNRIGGIKRKNRKTVLFGLRPCDMNAIKHLDNALKEDELYKEKRKNTLILGVQCVTHFKNCFCHITDTFESDNYDLLFIESENNFFIQTGSKKGESLIKNFRAKVAKVSSGEVETLLKLIKQNFMIESKEYKIKINQKKIEEFSKCLSCNMCNAVCPTCTCFLVEDEMNNDLKSGKRYREWDSCHLQRYTKVAGGFVFRKERMERIRNWVMCKFDYSLKNYGSYGCVGCGRCVSVCPVKINIFNSIEVK